MFARRTQWNTQDNAIAQAVARHRASGQPLIDLTETNPTRCGFLVPPSIVAPHPDPQRAVYAPDPRGLAVARTAIANLYAEAPNAVSTDNILLTSGTSEAYSHLFRLLCNPGDAVLVPAPSYPLLDLLADLNDVTLIPYPLYYIQERWEIDLAALRAAVTPRTRAIVIINPNNPTGSYIRRPELERITEIAADHPMAIIADEVFSEYKIAIETDTVSSLARQQNQALAFILGGLSKSLALPQLKLSWMVLDGPKTLVTAAANRLDVMSDTYLSVGSSAQLALPELLNHRSAIQSEILARIRTNLAILDRFPDLSHLRCEGGWSAVLRLPQTLPDEQRVLAWLDRGVLVDPGAFYGFASPGYVVISLIVPETEFAAGIQRINTLLSEARA